MNIYTYAMWCTRLKEKIVDEKNDVTLFLHLLPSHCCRIKACMCQKFIFFNYFKMYTILFEFDNTRDKKKPYTLLMMCNYFVNVTISFLLFQLLITYA